MLFDEDIINKIISRNNILNVIKEYTQLKKVGKYYIGLCPMHNEVSPSFYVDYGTKTYYCYGCGNGGNVINFIMHVKNYSFEEAVLHLAKRVRIEMPEMTIDNELLNKKNILLNINRDAAKFYYHQLHSDAGIVGDNYCKKRQLSDNIIMKFGLGYSSGFGKSLYSFLKRKGYSDKDMLDSGLIGYGEYYTESKTKQYGYYDKFWNRLMFPIMNEDNKIIGFGGRVLGDGKPKYLNSPETLIFDKGRNLYGLNLARYTKFPYFIVCEGNVDVISMHQAGFSNAVASLGTALTIEQVKLIGKYTKRVVLAYDNDAAGTKAAARAYEMFHSEGIETKIIDLSPCKDPDEFIKTYGIDKFKERICCAEDGVRALVKSYKNEYSENEYYDKLAQKLVEL